VRLLLDTHVFLWWISDTPRISDSAYDAIADPENEILMSPVSGWEISIKEALGRLELPGPPRDFVPEHIRKNRFGVLPVSMQHALEVSSLPPHHQDPFDRLLIAQARSDGIPVVSGDAAFSAYEVDVLW
jgi:PIN domain nuclease of toxin-antitoxin system